MREDNAIYLYCFAREESLSVIGDLARQGLSGVDERYPVSFLTHDGSAAVIGEVALDDFNEKNLGSLDWVAPRALRHEKVVEMVMRVSPVLPVKFGTIFLSRTNLDDILSRHAETISCGLEELRGKTEWTVKGYLNEELARLRISAEIPEISTRLAHLPLTPGTRYLAQKKINAMIADELDEWTDRTKLAIYGALMDAATKSTNLNFSPRIEETEPMVFHLGFLVADDGMRDFCLRVDEQQRLYGEHGLRLEMQGPWPPHHFCPTLASTNLV